MIERIVVQLDDLVVDGGNFCVVVPVDSPPAHSLPFFFLLGKHTVSDNQLAVAPVHWCDSAGLWVVDR